MTYVLVSLVGDDTTQANDVFARWFAERHQPARAFHCKHPDRDRVALEVRRTRLAIVMGHDGGGSLRASSDGPPWATPEQFAAMFAGARVWVYACKTRSGRLAEDLDSFGRKARKLGVSVFAGHAAAITAPPPFSSMPILRDQTYEALARAFRCFLQGSNSADEIRRHALRRRGRGLALTGLPIEDAFKSLRVLA